MSGASVLAYFLASFMSLLLVRERNALGGVEVGETAETTTATGSTSHRGAALPSAEEPMNLRFRGNVVLIPEVYRSVLAYAGWDRAPEDPEERQHWIEETLEGFLRASGYELASVVAIQDGEGYELLIDEGRLDKIIFRNVDPWTTVQLIFLLDLPGKVFNRDLVDRRLERVRQKMLVRDVTYEVVPLDEPEHRRLQIEDPGFIEGLTLLRPGEPHELRVSFERADERAGLDVALGVQPPDGIVLRGRYLSPGVFVRKDRTETLARLGIRATDVGRVPGNRIGLSQAGLGLVWSSPSAFELLRFTARVDWSLEARRREDLDIVNYFFSPIQLALGFALERAPLLFATGWGVEQRIFFGAREEEGTDAPILDRTEGSNRRTFFEGSLGIELNPDRLRRDRPHAILLSGRYLWPLGDADGDIYEVLLDYENTLAVGFDELRYEARGAWLGGSVPFYSELPMGRFLRSAFQGSVFAQKVAALAIEYRFSLSRDTLKLGLFNDIAVYESLDAVREPEGIRGIDNFGVGLHILLIDAFQVSGYGGVGIRTDGETDVGFSLIVRQAY